MGREDLIAFEGLLYYFVHFLFVPIRRYFLFLPCMGKFSPAVTVKKIKTEVQTIIIDG